MNEQAAASESDGGFGNLKVGIRSDVFFAMGMIGILVVLLLPVPPFMLDFLLALSITIAVLILMTCLLYTSDAADE